MSTLSAMGKEDEQSKIADAEVDANGTTLHEKVGEAVIEKKETDGVGDVGEDSRDDEINKMDMNKEEAKECKISEEREAQKRKREETEAHENSKQEEDIDVQESKKGKGKDMDEAKGEAIVPKSNDEKAGEAVTENTEKDGVGDMGEDSRDDEINKMDMNKEEANECKASEEREAQKRKREETEEYESNKQEEDTDVQESNKGKEEAKGEAMEEEFVPKLDDEMEEKAGAAATEKKEKDGVGNMGEDNRDGDINKIDKEKEEANECKISEEREVQKRKREETEAHESRKQEEDMEIQESKKGKGNDMEDPKGEAMAEEVVPKSNVEIEEKSCEAVLENKEKDGVGDMGEDNRDDDINKIDVDKEEAHESKISEGREAQKAELHESSKQAEDIEVQENKEGKGTDVEETKDEAMEEKVVPKSNDEIEEKVPRSKKEKKKLEEVEEKKKGPKKFKGTESMGEKVTKEKAVEEEKEQKTPVASRIERPIRKRKSVKRLGESSDEETVKELCIEKGHGTALQDIPNVAYKLSKRKIDDTVKSLHIILFKRKAKVSQVKNNISQFSGFVWHDNEHKQKLKIKERLDKCVREKLLDFCDVLDIQIPKANSRKEDIVAKLIDFLVAPHATTTELLAEKEQSSKGKKRKMVEKSSASASGTPPKLPAKSGKESGCSSKREDRKNALDSDAELDEGKQEDQENVNGAPEAYEDRTPKIAETEKENDSDSESVDEKRKQKRGSEISPSEKESTKKMSVKKELIESSSKQKKSKQKESVGKSSKKKELAENTSTNEGSAAEFSTKTKKLAIPMKLSHVPKDTPRKSSLNYPMVEDNKDPSPRTSARKKNNVEVKKSSSPKKSAPKEKIGKRIKKDKESPKEGALRPSDDEIIKAISEILKEVDFNTSTFTDILNILGKRFDVDLASRKPSIKLMIQDELTKLADEADDDGEDEGDGEN